MALRKILEIYDKAIGAVVAENGSLEAAECDVKRYFGGNKGAALEIRQAWRVKGRQGSSRVEV